MTTGTQIIPCLHGPLNLLQEIYRKDPWKMLVCCIFLNQTNRKQVDQVREEFFLRYPNAESLLKTEDKEIVDLIRPLGFYNRRTRTLKKFSEDWVLKEWKSPLELHGIGKYAFDSWEIFQNFNFKVEPTDSVLKKYLEWVSEYIKQHSDN
jgi:methyl-CpG-binding domain protein 4